MFNKFSSITYTEIERINLIRELTQLHQALLRNQMDDSERQNIFGPIQICANCLQTFVNDMSNE